MLSKNGRRWPELAGFTPITAGFAAVKTLRRGDHQELNHRKGTHEKLPHPLDVEPQNGRMGPEVDGFTQTWPDSQPQELHKENRKPHGNHSQHTKLRSEEELTANLNTTCSRRVALHKSLDIDLIWNMYLLEFFLLQIPANPAAKVNSSPHEQSTAASPSKPGRA